MTIFAKPSTAYGSHGIFPVLGLIVLVLSLTGCGGGGGGGTTGVTYSGLTTPAVITQDNARDLAAGAMATGVSGSTFSDIAALSSSGEPENSSAGLFSVDFSRVMAAAAGQIDFTSGTEKNVSAALASDSDTVPGSCGGAFSYNVRVDSDTGAFSGSITFNDYCEGGTILDGRSNFSGQIALYDYQLVSFTYIFDNVTATDSSQASTMAGELTFSVSGDTISALMDMMVRDDNTGKVSKVENYVMTITDNGSYIEMTLSGRFFDPDYGYVDLQTPSAFIIQLDDNSPTTGQLVLTGDSGTAARLTAVSFTECRVQADTDGDGTYDYDSGPIAWEEL